LGLVGVILLWGRVGLVGDGEMDGWMVVEGGGVEEETTVLMNLAGWKTSLLWREIQNVAGSRNMAGNQMVVAKMAGSEYLGSSSFTLAPRHHYHTLVPKLDEIMMDAPAQ